MDKDSVPLAVCLACARSQRWSPAAGSWSGVEFGTDEHETISDALLHFVSETGKRICGPEGAKASDTVESPEKRK